MLEIVPLVARNLLKSDTDLGLVHLKNPHAYFGAVRFSVLRLLDHSEFDFVLLAMYPW